MFLLNDEMIAKYRKRGLLGIEDFDQEQLYPTYYYFRIGRLVRKWDVKYENHRPVEIGMPGRMVFEIPSKGYVSIESLERFHCSDKVIGIFGQNSNLILQGLRLNHSPTIDPTFTGVLDMGIENLLDWPVPIKYGDPIAKISFFDISDTYPIKDIRESGSKDKIKSRETRHRE